MIFVTLAELLEAASRGDAVYVDLGDEYGDRIIHLSAQDGRPPRGFGSTRGRVWIADNFDDPLDYFKDYM
jgi:hypothetical protein